MKVNFFKNFFEKRKNLSEEFPRDSFKSLNTLAHYPLARSLEDKGIYAWQLLFFTNTEGVRKAFDLMNRIVKCDIEGASGTFFMETQGGKVYLYISDKFQGKLVTLITNNVELISDLQSLGITPGAPWISFPEIDPDGLGSRQGDFEYWWDSFWLPFWNTLTACEKARYLHMNNAPPGWVEYFEFYDELLNQRSATRR